MNEDTIKFNLYSDKAFEILKAIWWILRDTNNKLGLAMPDRDYDNNIMFSRCGYNNIEKEHIKSEIMNYVKRNLNKYKENDTYVFKSEDWCWEKIDIVIPVEEMQCFIDIVITMDINEDVVDTVGQRYGMELVDELIGSPANPFEIEKNKYENELAKNMKKKKISEQEKLIAEFKTKLTAENIIGMQKNGKSTNEIVDELVNLQNKVVDSYLNIEDEYTSAIRKMNKLFVD